MKIVHAISTLAAEHGGPTKACLEMANYVSDHGHDVVIHATDYQIPPEALKNNGLANDHGVRIFYHPSVHVGPMAISPGMAKGLKRDIRDADAVHLHSLYLLHDYYVWKYCQAFGKPYLVRPHGSLNPAFRNRHKLRKWVVNTLFMDRVIDDAYALHFSCKSEEDRAQPAARGKNGVVIPNGLNTRAYSNLPPGNQFRELFPDDPNKKIILFLGRLNFIKGLDLLADAFAKLRQNNPHAYLLIAGPDGGMEEKLKRQLADNNVSDAVRFTGLIMGDDKLAAFAAADVFVLPSYSENFGISAVEAMAAGVPTIITDQVNIHHEIAEDGAGVIVSCDSDDLHQALDTLLQDQPKLDQFAERGKTSIKNRYDWEVVAPSLVDVYARMSQFGNNKD